MLYGVEINEPYQVQAEFKVRCMLSVGDDYAMSWCRPDRPARVFATPHQDAAERIAKTLAESWGAQVVPVEEGVVRDNGEIHEVVKAFEDRARTRARQTREIR